MARARNIKPGFFKNEELAECTPFARLCFAGLWVLADREGRLEDRPKRIKGELFAFDSVEVEPLLDELTRHEFLLRYVDRDGLRFIQILNFVKHQNPHQRESASTIPAPNGSTNRFQYAPVTAEQRVRILERDGYKCRRCNAESELQVDHVTPRSRGGTSEDDNLQILCAGCNGKKSAKVEPRQDIGGDVSPEKHSQGIAKDAPENRKVDLAGGVSPADSLFSDSPIPSSAPPRRKSDAKASSLSSADADSSAEPTPEAPELKTASKAKTSKPAKKGSPTPTIPCPYAKIIALYHEKLPTLARVKVDSQARHAEMRKLWGFVLRTCKSDGTRRAETADQALAWIGEYFERASANDFLMGRNRRPTDGHWQADFDYLLKERGMRQVIEKTLVAGGSA